MTMEEENDPRSEGVNMNNGNPQESPDQRSTRKMTGRIRKIKLSGKTSGPLGATQRLAREEMDGEGPCQQRQ